MAKKANSGTGGAESAVTRFLSEFATYLLAAGLTHSQFTALARVAYFRAAAESATLRNRRLNQSAVAAMTGLTRHQVRELARQGVSGYSIRRDRIAKIIEGWTTDPRFTKSDSSPRRLRIGIAQAGFSELVRRYGGDIPPRATLREMQRSGFVRVQGEFVLLDSKAHGTRYQARLRQVSDALTNLIEGVRLSVERSSPVRALNREITYSGSSAKGRVLLQKRSAESLRAFLLELQAAGTAASIESPPNPKSGKRTIRTRVVLISEELSEKD